MDTVIGIDLGTSTTEAAVFRNGKAEMLLTLDQKVVVPSVVGIDKTGNWVVGEPAKAQLLLSPETTVREIKRKIGKGELIPLGKRKYSPISLSAKLLEYVRGYASEYLGEEIRRAVISVPAYFDDIQRTETLKAGQQAGFAVERILNEPTAAALSYGLDHMEEESHILVYDLGGGTFDVTLLEMFDGILEVKASSGDNELGGKDFDQKLVEELLSCFQNKHGLDLRGDRYAMARIRDEAEACKMALSDQESYRVLIPMIAQKGETPLELDETISAARFEELTRDLLERTHDPIDVVLHDSQVEASQIDKIILVGGSTRMPMVAKDIEDYLGLAPVKAVDPDFAVAQGAAIQAGIIAGEIDPAQGLVMTDVNPYTLGIRTTNRYTHDYMSVMIPRNVTIPTERDELFYTVDDYQTGATVSVYQGESELVTSNHFLGEFHMSGIPPKRSGKEALRVTFGYDLNGILNVRAQIVSTGKEASIQIDMKDAGGNRQEEDPAKTRDGWEEDPIDVSKWKSVKGSEKYRAVIRRTERLQKKLKASSSYLDAQKIFEDALYLLKRCIIEEDWEIADETTYQLADMIELLENDDDF